MEILYELIIVPIELLVEVTYGVMYKIIGNCGIAIIAVSLVVQTLILPLYKRAEAIQDEERKRQYEMSYWIKHIKRTFKGDEQLMMLSAYYKEQNYKSWYPLKSSFSILLQIPFFIAAYHYLSNLSAISGQSFLFIKDLGVPDNIVTIGGFGINILPILMTVFNLISGVIYTRGLRARDKVQIFGLAAIFLVLLYNSPSGLVLYWTMNNLYSMMKNVVMKLLADRIHIPKPKLHGLRAVVQSGFEKTGGNGMMIYLLSALFMTALLGGVIALNVVGASPEEFINDNYGPGQIVINNMVVYVGIFMVWGTIFIAMMRPVTRFVVSALFFAAAIIAAVDCLAFATNLGTMSTVLIYDENPVFSGSEKIFNLIVVIALLAICVWIAFKHPIVQKRILQVLAIGAIAMVALSGGTLKADVKEIVARMDDSTYEGEEIIHLSTSGKNVIVFMLDRAISGYVPFIFDEKPDIAEAFEGFTYYPNTLAFGAHTNFASPALFGGYEYTPEAMNKRADESLMDKHDEALRMMPQLFSGEGYQVSVCSPPYAGYSWYGDLSIFDGMDNVSAYDPIGWFTDEVLAANDLEYYSELQQRNFIYYSIMKICPVVIQPLVYYHGNYWTQVESPVSTLFLDNYTTLTHLTDLTEITEDDSDNMLIMQNSTTHDVVLLKTDEYVPVISSTEDQTVGLDYQTAYVGGVSMELESYSQQAHYMSNVASYAQLADWFSYIKAKGCWDNTRIIIVSDHGYDLGQFDYMEFSNGIDVEFYNALLLVKDFGATEYTVSDEFMTNADVPVLAVSGIIENAVNPYTGNLISSDDKINPQYVTTSDNLNVGTNNGNVFDTSDGEWYAVTDNIFNEDNWTKEEEPK